MIGFMIRFFFYKKEHISSFGSTDIQSPKGTMKFQQYFFFNLCESCHLDRSSNVEIDVEMGMFFIYFSVPKEQNDCSASFVMISRNHF